MKDLPICPLEEAGIGTWKLVKEGVFLQSSSLGAGEEVEAGLPELYGEFGISVGVLSYLGTTKGAMGKVDINTNACTLLNDGKAKSDGFARVGFWASKFNSIYGNSETVQPPAIKAQMWERIA